MNLLHLNERLIQSGYIEKDKKCDLNDIKQMLIKKFEYIDFEQAKSDVEPFIKDITVLNVWNYKFFKQITELLTAI